MRTWAWQVTCRPCVRPAAASTWMPCPIAQISFLVAREVADQVQQARIIPQVFRRPAAQNDHGREFASRYRRDGHVGIHVMALPLYIGFPTRFEVVHDHVQPSTGRRRDHRFPSGLQEPVIRVQRLVTISAVSRDNEDLSAHRRILR